MYKVWIARDKDGSLYAYNCKPVFYAEIESFAPVPYSGGCIVLKNDSYPEVTFENSPLPLEVMLDYGK